MSEEVGGRNEKIEDTVGREQSETINRFYVSNPTVGRLQHRKHVRWESFTLGQILPLVDSPVFLLDDTTISTIKTSTKKLTPTNL